MKQEYLIETEEQLKLAESFNFDGVEKVIKTIPGKDISILLFSDERNNFDVAVNLSKVHDEVMLSSSFSILTNGSSQYFLKALFPKVNDMEYKLRKLLHIASSLNLEKDMEEGKKYIKKLESESLGNIFDFLFTDPDLNEKFKNVFNDKIKVKYNENKLSRVLTKKQYLEHLAKWEEKTPWQQLLGNRVPTLVNRYLDVEKARNDVAHAHNINTSQFNKHEYLFDKVIKELDSAIYDIEKSEMKYDEIDSFNKNLANLYTNYSKINKELKEHNISLHRINMITDNLSESQLFHFLHSVNSYQANKIRDWKSLGEIFIKFGEEAEKNSDSEGDEKGSQNRSSESDDIDD